MGAYTVHVPAGGGEASPEEVVFVRDAFSWPAFFFGPLWLAWNRAWLAALLWTAALAALAVGEAALELSHAASAVIALATGAAFGFEGSRLIVWTLARKGYVESAVVVAESVDEAEERFFSAWRPGAPSPLARISEPKGGATGAPVVGGLI